MKKAIFLIFGAGAIGTYVGGSLALAGNRVVFVEQRGAVGELRIHGLKLDLNRSPTSVYAVPGSSLTFADSIEEALGFGPFELAIYALKSFDTKAAVEQMKPFSDKLPPILCLSNGVENEANIATVLGAGNVIAGVVTTAIGRRSAGDIVVERMRGMGLEDRHPLSLFSVEALNAAGLNAHLFKCAADMKWSKMVSNLPANATSAILNMTAAEVFANPHIFRLEMGMLRESLNVMRANHIQVVDLLRVPVRILAIGSRLPEFISRPLMVKAVGGGRGGKMPSFHIDLYSGRGRSEVEWLNGAVVRFGEKAGLATPINKALTDTLVALTKGEIPLETFERQPEKLLALVS
ncbi:MAG: ketopantoate reductase family protein [Anaerolineales bacterium]